MADLPRIGVPDGAAETRQYARIMAQAFNASVEVFEPMVRSFRDDVRVIREGEQVNGGLVIYDMAQYFGGAPVPTWGIAGVAVRAEARARGHARELMRTTLRENFESGAPISTLYPAAPKLYRNLGWEFAGSRCLYCYRLAELPSGGGELSLREATDKDLGVMAELYTRRSRNQNGCLHRIDVLWNLSRRATKESPLHAYVVERDGKPEGYVTYTQQRSGDGFHFDLRVRDLVYLTHDAALAILAFFTRHRSVADNLYFYAAPEDPLLIELQRDQHIKLHERLEWMLRVVHVQDALQQRGYSPHVSAAAGVKIADKILPENAGHWQLELKEGRMTATPGGRGGPLLDVRGLAALYTGCQSPTNLRAAGLLSGSDRHDEALAAMFAGSAPWMPDFF